MKKAKPITLILFILFLCGCTSAQEKEKFKNSYGVLYPVTKVGEGISAIGEGFQSLSQPKQWSLERPENTVVSLTDEQKEYLDSISVAFDFSVPIAEQNYLAAGSYAFGPPIRNMLMRVENTVGARFDWRLSPMINDIAMAFPGGVILINPNIMRTLSVPGQYVFLFHEAGHHILGHTSQLGLVNSMGQPWITREREANADRFAGNAMRSGGFSAQEIAFGAMDAFKGNPPQGTNTHPPRDFRIMTVRAGAEMN